jgi:cellulose synthase/poly-beta-1,6-N-acetylglucosamine synthase-like glycosyltransferase
MGYRVDVVYVPEMATREETPQTLMKFVRQRVRWMQGFIQVFSDGQWRELPSRGQRLMAVYILGFQFFQAYTGIVAPVVFVCGFFFSVPVIIVLVSTIPLGVLVISVLIDLVMLHEFGRLFEAQIRVRDYAAIVYGVVLFQVALAVAAVWAVVRHLRGHTNWVKTAHAGAHLEAPELAASGLAGVALAEGGAR